MDLCKTLKCIVDKKAFVPFWDDMGGRGIL